MFALLDFKSVLDTYKYNVGRIANEGVIIQTESFHSKYIGIFRSRARNS